jgi:1,4-dihydroxy-2-naphthoate octaprenyltransferase
MIRFRLKPRWTFKARAALYGLTGLLVLVLSLFAAGRPWLWATLATLPLFLVLLRRQQRSLQSRVAALLDAFARENEMVRHSGSADAQP